MSTFQAISELRYRIRCVQRAIIFDDPVRPRYTSESRSRLAFAIAHLTYAEDMLMTNSAKLAAQQYERAMQLVAGIVDILPHGTIIFRHALARAS